MANLATLIHGYKGDLDRGFQNACMELFGRVVMSTPVDTGVARMSWIPNGDPELGEVFQVTSNLSYIRSLEYGHSDQAPKGMLRENARSWQDIVRRNMT